MGLSASQGRMLLLTARKSDLEFRAQQISQKRLLLSQQLEQIAVDYEDSTSNRQMKISLYQVDSDDSTKQNRIEKNLTYAALVSGAVRIGSALSGIEAYDRTEVNSGDYSSNVPYRLVDPSGAIVVSSEEEIPGASNLGAGVVKQTSVPAKAVEGKAHVFETTSELDGAATDKNYYITANKGTDLSKELDEQNSSANKEVTYYPENNIVLVNGTYYNIENGTKIENVNTSELKDPEKNKTLLVNDISKYTGTSTTSWTATKGADSVYTVSNSSGTVVNRYIVDKSLKYGTTDSTGTIDGPNYLQDCIRNGKYLVQKGRLDTDGEDPTKYVWNSVSWDATTNISDGYYTEDDDTAKAKYDRLQNQIQSQDKKLELELDNIETQRNAVNTETESVEKVIKDNVEKTFKTFA